MWEDGPLLGSRSLTRLAVRRVGARSRVRRSGAAEVASAPGLQPYLTQRACPRRRLAEPPARSGSCAGQRTLPLPGGVAAAGVLGTRAGLPGGAAAEPGGRRGGLRAAAWGPCLGRVEGGRCGARGRGLRATRGPWGVSPRAPARLRAPRARRRNQKLRRPRRRRNRSGFGTRGTWRSPRLPAHAHWLRVLFIPRDWLGPAVSNRPPWTGQSELPGRSGWWELCNLA